MSRYDVVNEAVIDAAPEIVWEALVAELQGARRWWVPHTTFRPGPVASDQRGGSVEITVHTGGVGKPGPRLRFLARTRDVFPGERLVSDYVYGAFRGSGEYTLESLDGGRRTRISLRWRTDPHGWVRFLGRAVDIGEKHFHATQDAFSQLAVVVGDARRRAGQDAQ